MAECFQYITYFYDLSKIGKMSTQKFAKRFFVPYNE